MFEKKFKIKKKEQKMRIDVLCHEKFPEISRSQFSKRAKFFCNNEPKNPRYKVSPKEEWVVQYEEKEDFSEVKSWDFEIKIIAESASWVAVEKPVGLAVHPSQSDPTQKTLVNALRHQFKRLSPNFDKINGQKIPRPGLVHRLDKLTSGVLLVAKTAKTHAFLQENWGKVQKIYYAIVEGKPPKKGKVDAGIARDKQNRQRMTVLEGVTAKDAVTYFETISSDKKLSLLKIKIPTGRTHQIRVHLSSIGFPVLGDEKYNGHTADRLFLHAHSLTFPNPDKDGAMTTVKSEIPEEFEKIIK